jgi:hypothetical protein
MKRMNLLLCVLILMFVSMPVIAQEIDTSAAAPAAAVQPATGEAIEARIKVLKKQEDAAEAKLYDIRKKIAKSDAVADLRTAADDADKAYQDKKVNDPKIIAAKKADRDASAAFKAAVLAEVKSGVEGAAILKEISELETKRADLSLQAAVAELKLTHKDSPVARALAADPVVKEFYAAYQSAERGAVRDKARADYYKVKQAALEKLPQAIDLIAEIKAADKGADDAEAAIETAEDKLDKLYDTVADSDDQDIVVAKAKREAARKEYQQAYYGGEMQAARDARAAAQKVLSAKVKALSGQDPAAIELKATLEALDKEIDELKSKARALRKESSE